MFSVAFLKELTLLVVEDSINDREIMCSFLRKMFKEVYEASDGEEALELYNTHASKIDIIISDINMPVMDGIEFLKRLRQINPLLPFVFMTAKTESEHIIEAINQNANYYILKPINTKLLLEKLLSICEHKYYEIRLKQKQEEVQKYLDAVDNVAIIYKMYANGNITYMNKSMLDIIKCTPEEAETLNFNDIIHPNIPQKYIDETWEKLIAGETWKGNTKFVDKNKVIFYLNSTIFKIQESAKEDEYISISFLTTQENIKNRDFKKKVIQNIQDFNKKEYEYKTHIEKLEKLLTEAQQFTASYPQKFETEKRRALEKDRQLHHYEQQMQNFVEKYENLLKQKQEEIQKHIVFRHEQTKKMDKLYYEKETLKKEKQVLKQEILKLENISKQRELKIKDLKEVLQLEEDYKNLKK
ncbi:response regulator [Candidatus Marinarcus aquaticus]|uniref:Response regulatory domain-containing protein n=1 Tax=Candidatus Marinarcus aquaticus TaxID=2044504 RepID=A0A4Q0XT46_9BACT|nr:response regulator [Candidatus Marinarcus aquaticus]RXJ60670.1 hypothetical protein CRV04_01265 [Candidatus Marinarcus aquaticus]